MKRIKLKHGTARVSDNISTETIEALNKMTELVYNSEINKCQQCKTNDGESNHVCPYACEIANDSDSKCNCCDDCIIECCESI